MKPSQQHKHNKQGEGKACHGSLQTIYTMLQFFRSLSEKQKIPKLFKELSNAQSNEVNVRGLMIGDQQSRFVWGCPDVIPESPTPQ